MELHGQKSVIYCKVHQTGWTNGFGTAKSAIAAGGYVNPPAGQTAVTEEWTASLANKTITAS